jgi:hypothetical protein
MCRGKENIMSSQVDVSQIGTGTLDPGAGWEIFSWTATESDYNKERKRGRFFTVVPDPLVDGRIEIQGVVQMEITRVWNMVRTTIPANFKISNVFQWNVEVLNSGGQNTSWELIQAETNN